MVAHNSKAETRSKYDLLFPEIEEVLGPAPTFRPCTLVWQDVSVHINLKNRKLKRLVNNGKLFLSVLYIFFIYHCIEIANPP